MNSATMYNKKKFPTSVHGKALDDYLQSGWFRIRESIFTTSHLINDEQNTLNKVWWLRYRLDEVISRKSHKTICKKNQLFSYTISDFVHVKTSHNDLFKCYTEKISFETYDELSEAIFGDGLVNPFKTKCIEVFDGQELIAVGIFDIGKKSAQSILHFYNPNYAKYSLGKYLLLITFNYLKENNYTYYYPGYIVCNRTSFDYKLFLGENIAQYYNPETKEWQIYEDSILIDREYSEDELFEFFLLTFLKKKITPKLFYNIDRGNHFKGDILDGYLDRGWFRMQSTMYANSHIADFDTSTIFKVWRIKFVISEIKLHSSHKKIWRLNNQFKVVFSDKLDITNEDNELYSRYYGFINFDGYESIEQVISDYGGTDIFDTNCVRVYHNDVLIAMGLFDKGVDSIASILNFYDPNYSKFSMGKYIILLIIKKMNEWGFLYYFPGYIVSGKPKFDYKLFLGEESAYYFNKEREWVKFERSILKPIESTFEEYIEFIKLVSSTNN